MSKRKIKNKVGYVDNKYLNIDKPKGHYVYIRKVNKDGTCDINVFTSLEHFDKNIGKMVKTPSKIEHLKKGNTYAIPKKDSNLPKWSGITKEVKTIKTKNIEDIGKYYIKKRHYFYIGKFMNKKSKV